MIGKFVLATIGCLLIGTGGAAAEQFGVWTIAPEDPTSMIARSDGAVLMVRYDYKWIAGEDEGVISITLDNDKDLNGMIKQAVIAEDVRLKASPDLCEVGTFDRCSRFWTLHPKLEMRSVRGAPVEFRIGLLEERRYFPGSWCMFSSEHTGITQSFTDGSCDKPWTTVVTNKADLFELMSKGPISIRLTLNTYPEDHEEEAYVSFEETWIDFPTTGFSEAFEELEALNLQSPPSQP